MNQEHKPAVPDMALSALQDALCGNRRAHPRYLARWRAALISPLNAGRRFDGRTENVSISGAAIIVSSNLPRGEDFQVYMEITDQNGRPTAVFEARGRVMHCTLSQKEFKAGIAFTHYVADSDKLLRNALTCGRLKELTDPQFC
jgi:hypothetical protein